MKTFKCYYEKCPWNKESECTNNSPVINQNGLCNVVSSREEVIAIPLSVSMQTDMNDCEERGSKKDCSCCSLNLCAREYI